MYQMQKMLLINITHHLLRTILKMPNVHMMLIDAFQEYEVYSNQVKTYVGSKMNYQT